MVFGTPEVSGKFDYKAGPEMLLAGIVNRDQLAHSSLSEQS